MGKMRAKSQRGNSTILLILGMIAVSGYLLFDLNYRLGMSTKMDLRFAGTNALEIADQAILDYVIVSVKQQWCIGDNWSKLPDDKCHPMGSPMSMRRLLMSEQAIDALGDYFMVNVVVLPIAGESIKNYPACAAATMNGMPMNVKPARKDFSKWQKNWEMCEQIDEVSQYIPNLKDISNLKNVFSRPYFDQLGGALITVKRTTGDRQHPKNGRMESVQVTVRVWAKGSAPNIKWNPVSSSNNGEASIKSISGPKPIQVIRSELNVIPIEMNHFGLVLAGDMHLDGSTPKTDKGGFFPLLPQPKGNTQYKGIHFDSPIFINGNIVLPSEPAPGSSTFNKSTFVTFGSQVYLSTKNPDTGFPGKICQNGSKGPTSPECALGQSLYTSAATNNIEDYIGGFRKGLDYLLEDKGLDYVPGPKLGGKADTDPDKGSIVEDCAAVTQAESDLDRTNENRLNVVRSATDPNEYILLWKNNSSVGLPPFSLRHLNRFQTPKSDTPRGKEALCFSEEPAFEERFMRPHIYDNNNNPLGVPTPVTGKHWKNKYNPTNQPDIQLPAYSLISTKKTSLNPVTYTWTPVPVPVELTTVAASLNGDLLIDSPLYLFDKDSSDKKIIRNHIGLCPKSNIDALGVTHKMHQLEALDANFQEKATVIAKVDYEIILQDSSDFHGQLVKYIPALAMANPPTTLAVEDIPDLKNFIQNGNDLGIADQLIKIFGPNKNNIIKYKASALMGVNTMLVFQGVKDGIIKDLAEELKKPIVPGTIMDIIDTKQAKIDNMILSNLGITNLANAPATLVGFNLQINTNNSSLTNQQNQISNLQAQVKTLKSDFKSLESAATATPCDSTCVSAQNSQATLQTQIDALTAQVDAANTGINSLISQNSNLQSKIDKYNYLTKRKIGLNNLEAKLNEILTALDGLSGTNSFDLNGQPLGRSFAIEELDNAEATLLKKDGSPFLATVYAPNAIKLKMNLPDKTNPFVPSFSLKVEAFDPSYIYKVTGLTKAACNASPPLGITRVWAIVRPKTLVLPEVRRCIEFQSTRGTLALQSIKTVPIGVDGSHTKIKTYKNVMPPTYNNIFQYSYDQATKKEIQFPPIEKGSKTSSDMQYRDYVKTQKHPGFIDFKCGIMTSKFYDTAAPGPNDEDQVNEDSDLASTQKTPSDSAVKFTDFSEQTNHSWSISNILPFNEDYANSYDVNCASKNNECLLIDKSFEATPGKPKAVPPVPSGSASFLVKSIAPRCTIAKDVSFVSGFLFCRKLVIEGPRTGPLELAGTFIVGQLVMHETAVINGVYFRNIYHPASVKSMRAQGILSSESQCAGKLSQPIWHNNLTDANSELIERCVPTSLRVLAQPFTWNKVDPDCGVLAKYAGSASPGVMGERMSCKDNSERFFVVESWRARL